MPTLVNESGVTPVVQFAVPLKGTHNSTAAHLLEPDMLYNSLNVFLRRGKLRQRAGLSLLNSTVFDAPIIGGKMAVTPTDKILLAFSKSRLYTLSQADSSWQPSTIATFSDSDESVIDITFQQNGTDYYAVIAEPYQVLKKWTQTGGASTITPVTGVVPAAKSVCTTARRIIALVEPHTIRWSSVLTIDSWPALAIAIVAQTNDKGICVRSLGTLNFVIYKERSIYVAKAQAGSDAEAFNIQFVQSTEGPAGIHALVDVAGTHYYMTTNGRIGMFDGTAKVEWIADGLWLYLQEDIDPIYTKKIFGVYDYRLHTITFYYSRRGDFGGMNGMVVMSLPLEGADVVGVNSLGLVAKREIAAFLGRSGKPCSYAYEKRFENSIDQSIIFTSTIGDVQSFVSDENVSTDDGEVFDCMIQTGLKPLPEMKHHQLTIETFVERADGYGSVVVEAVTADVLESEAGTTHSEQPLTLDLNVNPVREYNGFNIPCRFFGLKYTWRSNSTVRYSGSTVYGRVIA